MAELHHLRFIGQNPDGTLILRDKQGNALDCKLPADTAHYPDFADLRTGTLLAVFAGKPNGSDILVAAEIAVSRKEEFNFTVQAYEGREGQNHLFKGRFAPEADGTRASIAQGVNPNDPVTVTLTGQAASGLAALFGDKSSPVKASQLVLHLSNMHETSRLNFVQAKPQI